MSIGRPDVLQKQFVAADITVIGVQEARTIKGRKTLKDYIVLASGCAPGRHLGVKLWIRNNAGSSQNRKNKIEIRDLTVVSATPRSMYVTVRSSALACDFLVLHVPHAGHNMADQNQFWSDLFSALDNAVSSYELFVLCDSNAHFEHPDGEANLHKNGAQAKRPRRFRLEVSSKISAMGATDRPQVLRGRQPVDHVSRPCARLCLSPTGIVACSALCWRLQPS